MFKELDNNNKEFLRICKQSKFTQDARYFSHLWQGTTIEGYFVENKIVGYIMYALVKSKNYLRLIYINTDDNEQGKGYGKQMMDHLFEVAKNRGCEKIMFKVKKTNPAIKFYEKITPNSIEIQKDDYIVQYFLLKGLLA